MELGGIWVLQSWGDKRGGSDEDLVDWSQHVVVCSMLQASIQNSHHVARVREQGFRQLVLGDASSLEGEDLIQQLKQEPAVELVRCALRYLDVPWPLNGALLCDDAHRSIYKLRVSIDWWTGCRGFWSLRWERWTVQKVMRWRWRPSTGWSRRYKNDVHSCYIGRLSQGEWSIDIKRGKCRQGPGAQEEVAPCTLVAP
jgi:hypothetical protein